MLPTPEISAVFQTHASPCFDTQNAVALFSSVFSPPLAGGPLVSGHMCLISLHTGSPSWSERAFLVPLPLDPEARCLWPALACEAAGTCLPPHLCLLWLRSLCWRRCREDSRLTARLHWRSSAHGPFGGGSGRDGCPSAARRLLFPLGRQPGFGPAAACPRLTGV